ncbi:MAG: diguanylate cyclase domain-containing protein [Planctomycetota bacterium]
MESTPTPTQSSNSSAACPVRTSVTAELGLTVISSLIEHLNQHLGGEVDLESSLLDPSSPTVDFVGLDNLVRGRLGVASNLFMALQARHAPTAFHSLRVALTSSSWSLNLSLEDDQRNSLEAAALLHDVGKLSVPDRILLKPGQLNREERATIAHHRTLGEQILMHSCASPEVLSVIKYVAAWWNGSRAGFDCRGEQLPLGARMVSIVEAYDAMTTDQVYRPALSHEQAIAELLACGGTQFDPQLAEQFCDLLAADQVKLTPELSRCWLNNLNPNQSGTFWTWNGPGASGANTPARRWELFQRRLLENMRAGVAFVDRDLNILLWNPAVEKLTGLTASSVLHQRWSRRLMALCDRDGRPLNHHNCPVARAIGDQAERNQRVILRNHNGEDASIDLHAVPVMGPDGVLQGVTVLLYDASRQITMERHLEKLHLKATRDPLTRVANRAEFDRVHAKLVDTHGQNGTSYSLLICDIDHFKHVNDTYGHQAGDDALVSFASLLGRSAGPDDFVARYGGEEFIMLCPNCDNDTITHRADKIRRELEELPQRGLDNRKITASFGVTEIQAGDTPETMLRRADRALFQAKESGRNQVVQLGSGMPDTPTKQRRNFFRRWMQSVPSGYLLEETLITTVPLAVTMEELRGFISDHHAEIAPSEDSQLRLYITQEADKKRRASDRPTCFIMSLQFFEIKKATEHRWDANSTIIRVSIQLAKTRDRRQHNIHERARLLFAGLQAYFMAQRFDGAADFDPKTDTPTPFQRLWTLLRTS